MGPLFSVRMRAAAGAPHEEGGRHVSGAEYVVPEDAVEVTVLELCRRARSRGVPADFVRITVERIHNQAVERIPCLPVTTAAVDDIREAFDTAIRLLGEAGVGEGAIRDAFAGLRDGWLPTGALRGAAVLDAATGERLDSNPDRGVRVSRLDYTPEARAELDAQLQAHGIGHFRVREALAIASKVLWAGVLAELCWSDDPQYTTGYVATRARGYVRIPAFKPAGAVGGRVFFVTPGVSSDQLARLLAYLERSVVLIDTPVVVHPPVRGSDLS